MLTAQVLELCAEGLGLESSTFTKPYLGTAGECTARFNYYPPCPLPSLTLGLGAHTDPNLLTILHQCKVGGLQIYRDGSWLSVKPLTNSFILNIGDSFEVSLSLSVFHMFEEELWTLTSGNPSKLCCNCFFPIIPSTTCLQLGASPSYESCSLYPRSGRFLDKKIFATTLTSESKYLTKHINMCCNLWVGVVCVCVLSSSNTNNRHGQMGDSRVWGIELWWMKQKLDCRLVTFQIHHLFQLWLFRIISLILCILCNSVLPSHGSTTNCIFWKCTKNLTVPKHPRHGFEAPNLYENSMAWEHQMSLETPHQTRGRLLGPRLTQTGEETRSRDENSVQVKKQTGNRLISFLT